MARQLRGRWLAGWAVLAMVAFGSGTARGQGELEVATEALPAGEAGVAYSAELAATGGVPPYSWRMARQGNYSESDEYGGSYEETGTFTGDAEYPGAYDWSDWGDPSPKVVALPFAFPFCGKVYTEALADCHGVVAFGQDAESWSFDGGDAFDRTPMVTAGWTRDAMYDVQGGEGLWVDDTVEGEVTLQWRNAFQYYSSACSPDEVYAYASFSVTLRQDGTIAVKYSPDTRTEVNDMGGGLGYSYGFSMMAGLSAGDGKTTCMNAWPSFGMDVTFAPPPFPAGLEWTADGRIQGTPEEMGEYNLMVAVEDSAGGEAERTLVLRVGGDGMIWDEQGKWTYTVSEDVATVTSGPKTGDVRVPATLGGHVVGAIGSGAFRGGTGLTSVTLPASVASIGDSAFNGCSALTNAVLGGGVRRIGNYAFHMCQKLVALEGTESLESIGNWTFNACNALRAIELPEGLAVIGEYAFQGCVSMREVEFPASLGTIGQYAFCRVGLRELYVPGTVTNLASRGFWDSQSLTNAVFGDGTRNIPWGSFDACRALRTVTLPEGLTGIGSIAFRGCTALEAVEFPSTLEGIGERAFQDCRGLAEVELPAAVSSLGTNVFQSCTRLTNAVVGNGVTVLPAGTFDGCTALAAVALPEGVTCIGSNAFRSCTALPEAPIPGAVTRIENGAFQGCALFAEVEVSAGVTELGPNVFAGCTGLTNAVVAASVASVPAGLFDGCTSLAAVSLPAGTAAIGNNALRNCSALPEVEIPENTATIGARAFQNCRGLGEVAIPCAVTAIGADAFAGCTGLEAVRTPSLECWLGIGFANAAANPLSCAHRLVAGGEEVSALVLPNGAESVGAHAFSGATGVTSVDFGTGVVSIGAQAFAGCTGLTEVSIPDQVAELGANAFLGCTALAKVEVPAAWWGTGLVEAAGLPEACVVTYRGMEPLEMLTAALPAGVAGKAYAAELEASGGKKPYVWSVAVPAVYAVSEGEGSTYEEPAGEPDASWFWSEWESGQVVELPFPFQFFGNIYTNVRVLAQGSLSFGDGVPGWYGEKPTIAVFWPDTDYWSQPTWEGYIRVHSETDAVTVSWNGRYLEYPEYMTERTVDFSVTLRPDGSIAMKYGTIDTPGYGESVGGTVGLHAGDGETEVAPVCLGTWSMSWDSDQIFALPPFPAGVEWTAEGAVSGTPEEAGEYELVVRVEDASGVGVERTLVLAVAEPSSATTESPVPVPHAWLEANAAAILAENGGDYEAAAVAQAESGRQVWECYVSGASLAAGGEDFKATFRRGEGGEWFVAWTPDQNAGLDEPVRAYRIEAKKALTDKDWTDVTAEAGDFGSGEWRFFRVSCGLPSAEEGAGD